MIEQQISAGIIVFLCIFTIGVIMLLTNYTRLRTHLDVYVNMSKTLEPAETHKIQSIEFVDVDGKDYKIESGVTNEFTLDNVSHKILSGVSVLGNREYEDIAITISKDGVDRKLIVAVPAFKFNKGSNSIIITMNEGLKRIQSVIVNGNITSFE